MKVRHHIWISLACLVLLLVSGMPASWAQGVRTTTTINSLPNDTTTGTGLYLLAKVVSCTTCGGVGKLVTAAITDTAVELFPVQANAGTSGSALYVRVGDAQCVMDATNASGKAGSFVVASPTTAGRCRQQDTAPATGMVIGRLLSDSTTAGQPARIDVQNINYSPGNVTGSGTVTSVAMTMPGAEWTVAVANPTTAASITVTKVNQNANLIYASPNGSAGAPLFRALAQADLGGLTLPPGGSAAGANSDLTGTYPDQVKVLQASTTFALPGTSTPTSISGTLANYTGCSGNSTCHLSATSSATTISGFQDSPSNANGVLKHVCNVGANAFTLLNETGSTAANQLRLTTNDTNAVMDDVTLFPWQCLTLRYSTSIARWMPLSQAVPDYLRYRSVGVIVGDPETNSPALVQGNDTLYAITNDLGRSLRLVDLACRADQGSSTVDVRRADTDATVLTGACTCNSTGWSPCSLSGTPTLQSFNGTSCAEPCAMHVRTVSVGGGTKYYVLKGKAILQ